MGARLHYNCRNWINVVLGAQSILSSTFLKYALINDDAEKGA
jgi:hypothetical protein